MSGNDVTGVDGHPRAAIRLPAMRLRRWLYGALVGATTLAGAAMMLDIMRDGGVTLLELVILALFTATFGWIAMPFWNAVIGFALALLGRDPLTLQPLRPPPPSKAGDRADPDAARTALVMPVHNEDPARVTAGLAAMLRSLERAGHGGRFDLFLLSDTTDPAIATEEEAAWAALCRGIGGAAGMHYRRRAPPTAGRKAGNIAEFLPALGRGLRLHGGARRRQHHDRRGAGGAGARKWRRTRGPA